MKIRFLFILCISVFQFISAQTLSPNAQVSVLTIGPGFSLNDVFGHNIFRVKDPLNNIDIAYDYGRFPFNEPRFYLNFARGKLNYSIGKSNYRDVRDFYIWQDRTIKEQILNISAEEKQAIFNYLKNNYKPENREYLYDFFYDNCATKIKDVLESTLKGKIEFHEPVAFEQKSFRTLIQNNLDYNSWGSVGIDIALGSVIDKTATPEEHMFLPEYIHSFFGIATHGNSKKQLIDNENTLYEQQNLKTHNSFLTSPLMVFFLIAIIILFVTYKDYKNQKRSKYLDVILFFVTGMIGVFLLLLWFATDHTATAQNYNLLWAFPFNILLIWKLKAQKPWVIKYLKFLVIMMCLLIFHWVVGIQVFAYALIPLFVTMIIRYIFLIQYFQRSNSR
ncbi:lipoprotein N-acyltransferase Lnb domain-containing protein [Hanstruepera ponticola]|uniref:lipoprotein N-acyltransferase Lnb domain-containing protein n=1 Tax=Hanstruepera ponticola TaxID=2042995 RepID=UPI000CF10DEA|nr:DUF4105 domain-containing protein [Hanstruepera ponticola]